MGRNYFSKHGGPYFINDGFSRHTHHHDDPNDIKPDQTLFYGLLLGFVSVILAIGITLTVLF
jgi:hypothetical protein